MNQDVPDANAQRLNTRPERRRSTRHRCELPIEVRTPGSTFPTQGQTTDLSTGGCYVGSRFSISVGTEVDLKLWVEGVALAVHAIVRTSDPGVGQGMQFLDLDAAGEQLLTGYFNRNEAVPATGEPSLHDVLII